METWNEKSEMVRKGPRREKQFSMRPTERVSESHKWLSPGWQAYGRRKKNINNIQQHHFLWKVLNGHFCDHGPTTFQELLTQQSDVQGSFKDHILDPRQGGQGGTIFHRWNWSTLRIHHGQRLQVHNPKWNPAPAVALQHTWNMFFVHILVRYHFRLIEFESFHPPGEKHGTQMTNNLPSLQRCW